MDFSGRISRLEDIYNLNIEDLNGKKMALTSHEIAIDRFSQTVQEKIEKIDLHEKSIIVLNNVVDERTKGVLEKLVTTINNALGVVPLTNDYEVMITENETKRSGKELHIKLLDREANKVRGLRTSSGTAVAQLVSFLMRVVLVGFSNNRNILIVDENFSGFQDSETINIFGSVLTTLAEQEDFQIIMVEHKSEFLNVPDIKNIMLVKENYLEGVKVENIIDARDFGNDI